MMAYELELLATNQADTTLALLRDLAAAAPLATTIEKLRVGDSWAACDFVTASSEPITIQVNLADSVVENRAAQARSEGVAPSDATYDMVFTITLVDDPDWDYLRAIIGHIQGQWGGMLFDEVSGFSASLD